MQVLFKVALRHWLAPTSLLLCIFPKVARVSILVGALSIWTSPAVFAQAVAPAPQLNPADHHDREVDARKGARSSVSDSERIGLPPFLVNSSRIRIEFQPSVQPAVAAALAEQYGFVPLDSFYAPDTNALVMLVATTSIARDRAVYDALSALSKDRIVRSAQLDTSFLPQDSGTGSPSYSYMNTQYVFRLIGLGLAQNMSTGSGADIALIDTWVDQDHPVFAEAALSSIQDGSPKSGNGGEGAPAETAAALYEDHGTRMAGVLAANGPIRGVAPNANVLLYDVFASAEGAHQTASGFYIARALSDAVTRNVDVVNISLCGPYDGLISRIISSALQKQVAIVAAAGNGGPLSRACYPAANDGVIAVTATDHEDHLYEHANHGNYITLAAPGVDILTAASKGKLGMATGTSFAAAHVTGMVALLRSRHPELSVDSIVKILTYSSKDMGPKGRDPGFGTGRLSALEAMILSNQDLADYEAFSAP
jgi:subtilisin family serine protease